MDSNNFRGNIGLGEREGRVYSRLVYERNLWLAHGIGRSGDLGAVQPKAAGSSLISEIAKSLVLQAIRIAGFPNAKHGAVLPLATGMTMSLVFCALRPFKPQAKKIVFCRIDQKSCLKSILTAGYEPIVIPGIRRVDGIQTDLDEIERILSSEQARTEILCLVSTTSCFAPREPDHVLQIARLCKKYDTFHIINNAYGVQSVSIMKQIQASDQCGRVDFVVQSTDKNFLVPVGGCVVASSQQDRISWVLESYPGRASASPSLDLAITLLEMGESGWKKLLDERVSMYGKLRRVMETVASEFGERVLETDCNEISIAMTLTNLDSRSTDSKDVTQLGSMLFSRFVSGVRVVPRQSVNQTALVCGVAMPGGFGAHMNGYPCSYLTAAAALGITEHEIDVFANKLRQVLTLCLRVGMTGADPNSTAESEFGELNLVRVKEDDDGEK